QPNSASAWKYLPPPAAEPDPHDEHAVRSGTTPEGWPILGARVRGKKHKHEGTHCDDWFEFTAAGPWTLVAVSDGAGLKTFSGVGARVACTAALRSLSADLAGRSPRLRPGGSLDNWVDKQAGFFVPEDLTFVQESVHRAMELAYAGLLLEADIR